jgi:DNA-binding NarL/FixJ family response regulator
VTLRCLIVDDSHQFLAAASALLESQGITVVGLASNTVDALLRAAELRPDVMLVDIDLGGESGLDLAHQLDRLTGHRRSAVILTSNRAEQDYAELITASPAVGFLSKTAISAGTIQDLLDDRPDRGGGTVSGSQET